MEIAKKKYPLVAIFRNKKDTTPEAVLPLNEVLLEIKQCKNHHQITVCRGFLKEGKKDDYDKLKDTFRGFTVCGTFEPTRAIKFLKEYSGFLILDIDKLDREQVQIIKEKICAMPLTFCCFTSPSGLGLKVIVKVSSRAEHHKTAYRQVKEIYEKELEIEIDKSGSDVSRLCYFSSDCNIYINEDAGVFTPAQEQLKLTPALPLRTIAPVLLKEDAFEKCVQLTENLHRYEEGSRNSFVHLLAHNCNRNGISEDEATPKIKSLYNYNDMEVSATIKSAFANGKTEFAMYPLKKTTKNPTTPFSQNGVVGLGEIIKRHDLEPPVPLIWSGIKKNSFGFAFGPSKSGKTTFCENLGMCIAAGMTEFFGLPLSSESSTVLFISLEEYWQNRTERNKKQAAHVSEMLGSDTWMEKFKVINELVPRQIASDEDWAEIEKMIVNAGANVVFIDSLTRLYEGGIEDSAVAKKICLKLRELTDRLNITLVVIHHTPKQIGKPLTQDSLAGSRILAQDADFAIGIGKSLDNRRYFKEIFFRYHQEQSDNVTVFDINGSQWLVPGIKLPEAALLQEPDGRRDETNPDLIFDFIDEKTNSPQGETYTKEMMTEFVTPGTISKQTLYNCLGSLEKDGRITKLRKGTFKSINPEPTIE